MSDILADYEKRLRDMWRERCEEARRYVRAMWTFFEHEEAERWDETSAQEIIGLQSVITHLPWLYEDATDDK